MINVTIFNEFYHEKISESAKSVYPEGIHMALKKALESDEIKIKTVTLDDNNCGITPELLKETDVLIWWGHVRHHLVPDEIATMVSQEVLKGMGIIFLHSAHHSKPFKLLMGTSCNLSWREEGGSELLWVCNPAHPIAEGIDRYISLEQEEAYCEPFGIPEPDELVFIGNYSTGEAFRAGCCYKRENGKVFYFQPGHETYRNFYNENIIKVIGNAIKWAKPSYRVPELLCPEIKAPREELL